MAKETKRKMLNKELKPMLEYLGRGKHGLIFLEKYIKQQNETIEDLNKFINNVDSERDAYLLLLLKLANKIFVKTENYHHPTDPYLDEIAAEINQIIKDTQNDD